MLQRLTLATCLIATALQAQQAQPSALTLAASTADTALIGKAMLDGRAVADSTSTSGWTAAGFGGGFALGVLGTGATWLFARGSDVGPPVERRLAIATESEMYRQAFAAGYSNRLKAKRKRSALVGGVSGMATATAVVLVYFAFSDKQLFEWNF